MTVLTAISADSHVLEPFDLWTSRLAGGPFADRAPRMVEQLQVMVMTHGATLEGDAWELHDPKGLLGMTPQPEGWEVEIQAGAYDPDTLCGWISGRLAISL